MSNEQLAAIISSFIHRGDYIIFHEDTAEEVYKWLESKKEK